MKRKLTICSSFETSRNTRKLLAINTRKRTYNIVQTYIICSRNKTFQRSLVWLRRSDLTDLNIVSDPCGTNAVRVILYGFMDAEHLSFWVTKGITRILLVTVDAYWSWQYFMVTATLAVIVVESVKSKSAEIDCPFRRYRFLYALYVTAIIPLSLCSLPHLSGI